ncbi:exodeoxyribonuclease, partial [Klebsiella pneumoniae]|nr:exodeoxyribonuclease [Klebsiella pneumoniae]
AQPVEDENDNAVSAGEGADEPPAQTTAVNMSKILAERCPDLTAEVLKSQVSENTHSDEVEEAEQAAAAWPEYFEPGRYEGVPNEVYHAANGISSTMVKDARVSLMYFEARHVSKTIQKVRSPVLDMGNLVHALALQPDQLEKEFSIEPEIPEGAFTTTATIRAFIDEYNNGLPVLLSADDIKRFLEEYNANLPAQVPLGTSVEETGQGYMTLPAEFQRIEDGQKQTATAMKACIKEYNATLPAQVKTSGGRDALLEQLALINPDMVAQEAQKAQPLKVSGTKADL